MASLLKMSALIALMPMMATRIGIKAFIFSFRRSRTGSRSFFFKMPRAANITFIVNNKINVICVYLDKSYYLNIATTYKLYNYLRHCHSSPQGIPHQVPYQLCKTPLHSGRGIQASVT